MLTISEVQKQSYLETYGAVTEMYATLRGTPGALRVKRAVFVEECEALPIDFVIDVELKVKRTVGEKYYDMYQRLAATQESSLLPELMKLTLGRVFEEYGLGVDGAYQRLYYAVKNDQMRSYMKGMTNGVFSGSDGVDTGVLGETTGGFSEAGV
jgi:hypothetical protein